MGKSASVVLSPQQLHEFIEIVPDNILVGDLQGGILDANSKILALLGFTREELLALTLKDLIHPEDLAIRPAPMKELRAGQDIFHERRYRKKDGSFLPVEVHIRAIDGERTLAVIRDFSRREKAEEDLRVSLDRLKLFDSLAEETILIHEKGVIVDVNRALLEKLGYQRQEMIGKDVSLFSDAPSAEKSRQFQKKGYPEGYYEINAKRKDGTTFPILVHGVDFELQGRKVRASSGWDLTEIQRAEQAMRESEERFKKFAEVTVEGIFLHDRGIIQDVNQALLDMVGYSAEELVGTNGFFLLDGPSQERLKEMAAKGYGDKPYELTVRRKDGSDFPAEFHGRGFRYGGKGLRVVSVWDLTERKGIERALRDSEANYREIFEKSNDAIFVHDLGTGKILQVNQRTCEMFGHGKERFMTGDVGMVSYGERPYTQEDAVAWIQKVAQEGPQLFEWRCRRADGSPFWAEVSLKRAAIAGQDRILAQVRDVTERKDAEQKVLRFERLAAVGQLAAGLAHEIRNPLAVIAAATHCLDVKGGERDPAPYFQDIRNQCKRLDSLVFDILDYSGRGGSGEARPTDPVGLLREALELARSQLDQDHQVVRVDWDLEAGLPQVPLNAQRIQRVFINLLLNAYQAMEPSGGTIRISCRREGRWVVFRFEDDGPGIPENSLGRFFEPFFTTKRTGSGLGLSICKRIVEEHHGEILAANRTPHGASLIVRIPLEALP